MNFLFKIKEKGIIMHDRNRDLIKEKQDEFWINYYAKFNIEYTPSKRLYMVPVIFDLCIDKDELLHYSTAVKYLISEFENLGKNTCSFSIACNYWQRKCHMNNIKCSFEDIKDAYNLAYGNGSEYEFKEL